ncbi:ethyl tert-butyl ether degradation protein EthD [Rhizorhabdus wittichii DC-6]|nr:ethyl tert-butyl ether degradation protein EthD [Rhizorhabdus wittichii DC-6]
MVRVSVLYPNTAGSRFDHDYYRDKHMPLAKARLGAALISYGIDKAADAAAAPYHAIGFLNFDSVTAFNDAFGPVSGEVLGDIPNYTDVEPILQISDVVVADSNEV